MGPASYLHVPNYLLYLPTYLPHRIRLSATDRLLATPSTPLPIALLCSALPFPSSTPFTCRTSPTNQPQPEEPARDPTNAPPSPLCQTTVPPCARCMIAPVPLLACLLACSIASLHCISIHLPRNICSTSHQPPHVVVHTVSEPTCFLLKP
ncbi:hypothetical protein BC567DRAFT_220877 [Phyllosticta citribraziliensis]